MSADGMGPEGLSDAEMQQMLAEMREAPAERILIEVINALLQAVQVKLGRPDARLLLDVVAAVTESMQGRTDAELVTQATDAVMRLRMAQVEAESEVSGSGPASSEGPSSEGRSGSAATDGAVPPPAPGPSPSATQTGRGPQSDTGGGSRLWTPGR